jgi:hypothetical protein
MITRTFPGFTFVRTSLVLLIILYLKFMLRVLRAVCDFHIRNCLAAVPYQKFWRLRIVMFQWSDKVHGLT